MKVKDFYKRPPRRFWGENSDKSSIERAVAQADWKTDSGKNYSELFDVEKIKYQREESASTSRKE